MDENKKYFDYYVFLSSFARNLIEVFIGTILYKAGFSLKNVILYYLLVNIFSLLLGLPCAKISKQYSNKVLSLIGILAFTGLQIKLNHIRIDYIYLLSNAFLFATYRRCYWIARRYYTLKVIDKKSIPKDYSITSIANQLSIIISAYIGSLLLEFISIKVLTIISILLFLISIIFLNKLKFEHENNQTKLDLVKTLKNIPISSIIHIGCFELQNVIKFLIPLYLYIYM